jgi:hypothetical protein
VPWAFSLEVHERVALVSGRAVLAHALAALVLTALLVRLDRLLAVLCRAGRALRRRLLPALPQPTAIAVTAGTGVTRARRADLPNAPIRGPPQR